MNQSLIGKVALVTGGTKGIGKSIADKLQSLGAKVIITARKEPESLLENQYFIASDLSQASSIHQLSKKILAEFGSINILINNAGANLNTFKTFADLSDEDWENELNLNLMSAVRINNAFLPEMIVQKDGVIINISSIAAKMPIGAMTMSYSTAKAALNAYSKTLSKEVGVHNIRVNVVSPGMVNTTLMQEALQSLATQNNISVEESTDLVMQQVGGIPLNRLAEPEEVANLVAFLASPDAKYTTGVNYFVDGGAFPAII